MPTEEEKRWMAAWRVAGPELERIRQEELRQLDEQGPSIESQKMTSLQANSSGLAIFQAWMMRWRVLELQKQLNDR